MSRSELEADSEVLERFRRRECAGLHIRGALAPNIVAELVEAVDSVDPALGVQQPRGMWSYPEPFSQLWMGGPEHLAAALLDGEARTSMLRRFGPDPVAQASSLLERVLGAPIGTVSIEGYEGSLVPGTFRRLSTTGGRFVPHCGRSLHKEFAGLYEKIAVRYDLSRQLSYLFMLRPAERGGGLRLFDLRWQDAQVVSSDRDFVDGPGGARVRFDELSSIDLEPAAGDAIVFDGANIWHEVTPVSGATERLTYAGFVLETWDGTETAIYS